MKWPDDFINKIINSDCLEVMKHIPDKSIDLILTDPPYGIKRDKGFEGFEGFGGFGEPIARRRYEDNDWDQHRPTKEYFNEMLRIGKSILIFGGQFFTDYLPVGNHWIVWDKLNTMPTFGDCELIWTSIKRNSVKKYTVLWNGLIGKEEDRYHPTQKPLKLISSLIQNYSSCGEIVFDPFVGSGTTAVACKELGRIFIGSEISPVYFEISNKRLSQEYLKLQ